MAIGWESLRPPTRAVRQFSKGRDMMLAVTDRRAPTALAALTAAAGR